MVRNGSFLSAVLYNTHRSSASHPLLYIMGNWDNDRSFSTESISPFAGIEFGRICKREQKDAYFLHVMNVAIIINRKLGKFQ